MKRIIITLCICTAWVASTYAQYPYTLKKCLEEGLANNYSIRITRNEEQISHNNATLANAGYLPTVDLSAGYTGTLDNTDTKSRSTGTTASERNIYDQTLKAGLDVNWTLFDGFNISTTYKKLKELERQGETNTLLILLVAVACHGRMILSYSIVTRCIHSLPTKIFRTTGRSFCCSARCPYRRSVGWRVRLRSGNIACRFLNNCILIRCRRFSLLVSCIFHEIREWLSTSGTHTGYLSHTARGCDVISKSTLGTFYLHINGFTFNKSILTNCASRSNQ